MCFAIVNAIAVVFVTVCPHVTAHPHINIDLCMTSRWTSRARRLAFGWWLNDVAAMRSALWPARKLQIKCSSSISKHVLVCCTHVCGYKRLSILVVRLYYLLLEIECLHLCYYLFISAIWSVVARCLCYLYLFRLFAWFIFCLLAVVVANRRVFTFVSLCSITQLSMLCSLDFDVR